MCRKHWVPEYILTSVDPPATLPTRGTGRLLEVVVHRSRKKQPGAELDAVKMSEVLPFIEFDLQRQLMLKLKVYGMNAVCTNYCTKLYHYTIPYNVCLYYTIL